MNADIVIIVVAGSAAARNRATVYHILVVASCVPVNFAYYIYMYNSGAKRTAQTGCM